MKRLFGWIVVLASLLTFSCSKEETPAPVTETTVTTENIKSRGLQPLVVDVPDEAEETASVTASYVTYLIRRGQHYSDLRPFKTVSLTEMRFFAKFDQSAIYQTVNPENQNDINKLWGFSEGFNNQYNSARIGWGYSNGAIRLYGYVYRRGVRYYQEITTVSPGQDISCSIRVSGSNYILTANGISVTLPRGTTNAKASGLQQYPYFGGDEVAPHNITILIKPA